MKQTINLDLTITGALAADYSSTAEISIPSNVRVCGLRFTEIANANTKNYDLLVSDKTGIRMDSTHRLDVLSVIAGSTFRNAPFEQLILPFEAEGNQKLKITYRLIDALTGGQTITLRVAAICEVIN